MMKATLFGTVILVLGFMCGCTGLLINDSSEKQMGTVTISLTDAPFPSDLVEEVNVTIDWIKFKITEDDGTEDETDFVVLKVNKTFNLLELVNGATELLGVQEIPFGEYSEVRMHVTEAKIKLKGSEKEMIIKIPSGNTSGLKIKIQPSLVVMEKEVSRVLLDFDVSRSFIVQAKSGSNSNVKVGEITGFNFNPVIRAANVAWAGNLSGTVEVEDNDGSPDFIKNAHIFLISKDNPEEIIATGKTDENGFYKIIGIPAGKYNVTCEKGEYNKDNKPVNVEIFAGKETKQNFKL
jgi:hypothetical protein